METEHLAFSLQTGRINLVGFWSIFIYCDCKSRDKTLRKFQFTKTKSVSGLFVYFMIYYGQESVRVKHTLSHLSFSSAISHIPLLVIRFIAMKFRIILKWRCHLHACVHIFRYSKLTSLVNNKNTFSKLVMEKHK